MSKQPFILVAAWVLAMASGCGPRSQAVSRIDVVGAGAHPTAAGEWQSVVAITQYGHVLCSGTLVAPTLVVTAAHCLALGTDPVASLKVYVGSGVEGGRYDGEYRISKAERHPDANQGNIWGSADFAFLVLAAPVDLPTVPLASTSGEFEVLTAVGAGSTIVGFGVADNATRVLGTKRVVEASVKFSTAQEVFIGDSRGDACGGDSGGPVFGRLPDGVWRQFGVTSRGPTPCGSDLYPGAFTIVTPYLCWLESESNVFLRANGERLCATETPPASGTLSTFEELCESQSKAGPAKATWIRLRSIFAEARQLTAPSCGELATWAHDVKELNLEKALLTDLTPLARFQALESLDIEDNFVADLGPLRELSNLKLLAAGWNEIQDFAPIAAVEARGGRVLGKALQNPGWRPHRDTAFVKACLAAESGAPLDVDIAKTTAAVKKAVCLGAECSCYTAGDNLQKSRDLDLSDAENLKTVEPLQGANNLQYLRFGGRVPPDLATLVGLESLRLVDGRAWPR